MSHDDARRGVALATIALMDLTDLNDAHSGDGLDQLVRNALEHQTAAVCVWPQFVARSVDLLEAAAASRSSADAATGPAPGVPGAHVAVSRVQVATVANFPGGDASIADVVAEVAGSLSSGADEIDLVVPYREMQRNTFDRAGEMVAAVGDLVHGDGRLLKVILETGELVEPTLIRAAAECAVGNGADFIKTSTGKTPVSATREAVEVMLAVIAEAGRTVGIKPSGGIRTVADAGVYLDLAAAHFGADWVSPSTFRFGASGLLVDALDTVAAANAATT